MWCSSWVGELASFADIISADPLNQPALLGQNPLGRLLSIAGPGL
jgi:hypothetical protein